MDIFAILAGLATGMVLGLFGSGGSIIALPALMYLLQVEPKSAIAMSLGVVGVTATLSAIDHWRRGNVDVRVALVFGVFGVAGTFAGARLGLLTPIVIQLGLFALVMYAAAWRMLKPAKLVALAAGKEVDEVVSAWAVVWLRLPTATRFVRRVWATLPCTASVSVCLPAWSVSAVVS
jgi:uncharacterized membrane protein YfcA